MISENSAQYFVTKHRLYIEQVIYLKLPAKSDKIRMIGNQNSAVLKWNDAIFSRRLLTKFVQRRDKLLSYLTTTLEQVFRSMNYMFEMTTDCFYASLRMFSKA